MNDWQKWFNSQDEYEDKQDWYDARPTPRVGPNARRVIKLASAHPYERVEQGFSRLVI